MLQQQQTVGGEATALGEKHRKLCPIFSNYRYYSSHIYAPDIFTNPTVCLEINQLKPLAWGPFLEYIWGIIIQITGSRLKTVRFDIWEREHIR